MAGPTTDQLNDVTFESGVDASGNVASPAFADWTVGTNPAAYDTTHDVTAKWYNDASGATLATSSTAGTAGGTVTYSFASGVTADQQAAFSSALTLWSDEVNVKFVQVASSASTDITFNVTNSGGTNSASNFYTGDVVGANHIGSLTSGGAITFNNSGSYGTIGSFSAIGGYGVSATVHEIGHAIGLGHSGPYDDGSANSDPANQQYNEFDSRQWSVMSYIDPSATAKYSNQYTVTGTNTSDTVNNGDGTFTTYQVAPETPMIDDILAAQRLYGASTSATLSGGQTFGFNCNIGDGAKSFFDFTQNVNPIITLYDTGTGNTLDCSGFSNACKINLNPGTFSTASYGTLTNNIGIAYGTKIDTAIGGSGNDTFTVNADNDTINGGGGSNTAIFSGTRADYTIVPMGGGSETVTDIASQTTDTLTNIQTLQFADQSVPVCFAGGTRIRVMRDDGPRDVPVEDLRVGDLVVTASGAHRPIRWLSHRAMDCRNRPRPHEALPVRIAAHAFGPNKPARDLFVSPGHSICVDVLGEVLIPSINLVNGTTVAQVEADMVTYWHVELDSHDILLAENLPAESYLEMGNRAFFVDAAVVDLGAAPDAPERTHADFCRPFRDAGPLVEAVRARLRTRATSPFGQAARMA